MVEKGIGGRIFQPINSYVKANNKYIRDCDKINESSYLKYWDVNNLYCWSMSISQKLPVNYFKWVEDISEFDERFMKSYNDENDEGYFLEADVQQKTSI